MKTLAAVIAISFLSSCAGSGAPRAAVEPVPVRAQRAGTEAESQADVTVTRGGIEHPEIGPKEHFTGDVGIEPLFSAHDPSRTTGAVVHFQPGARTAWHTHPLGQTLIVTGGRGRVQTWGKPATDISKGDVVRIPPGVKHWHGAVSDASMTHIAIQEELDGKVVDWMEPVSLDQVPTGNE